MAPGEDALTAALEVWTVGDLVIGVVEWWDTVAVGSVYAMHECREVLRTESMFLLLQARVYIQLC